MDDTMAYTNNIPRKERIILGCRAAGGTKVSKLAEEYHTNRQFVYAQREKVQELLDKDFDASLPVIPCVTMDRELIQKTIFGCMVICNGSTEDTQEFLETIFQTRLSIGTISATINALADQAKEFNDSISLEEIKTGAHDEIFQADTAVLVGVEPQSTYVYLCEGSETRDGTAWGCALLDKQKQGLNIETSVNDAGTGLIKGIQDVYPEAKIQNDIFHAEKKVSLCMYRAERAAYKMIRLEYKLEHKYTKAQGTKKEKHLKEYEAAVVQSLTAIDFYDTLYILYTWLKEAFQIGGYSYEERKYMLHFIINELEGLPITKILTEAITYLMLNQDSLLTFVQDIQEQIKEFAKAQKVDTDSLNLMWEQLKYKTSSKQYNDIEITLIDTLRQNYTYVRNKFNDFTYKIVRASSIVECINSLIRPYLSLKRAVYGNFLPLVQFYLNTRRYRRSRCKERVGKSPIELLTHRQYPSPVNILKV